MKLWIFVFALCLLMLIYALDKSKQKKTIASVEAYKVSYFPQQKTQVLIMILVLALISGLRFEIGGTDYFVYERVYKSLPTLKLFFEKFNTINTEYTTYGHEKGWLFIMSFFKTLNFNYNAFLFAHSVFFFYSLYKFLKNYNAYPMLTLLLFMYMMYFYNSMVSLRQSTTIAIFFLLLPYLQKRKFIKYFVVVGLSVMIHRAAIILVIPYFIYSFKPNKKFLMFLLFLSIPLLAMSIFRINILNIFSPVLPLINKLLGATTAMKFESLISGGGESINILHSFQYLAVLFLTIVFYDYLMIFNKNNMKMAIVMLICLYPILIIFRNYAILTRIKDYFVLFYGVVLGMMCYIRSGRYAKYILPVCILLCGWGFFRYIFSFDDGHFIEYQSIFDSIFQRRMLK